MCKYYIIIYKRYANIFKLSITLLVVGVVQYINLVDIINGYVSTGLEVTETYRYIQLNSICVQLSNHYSLIELK